MTNADYSVLGNELATLDEMFDLFHLDDKIIQEIPSFEGHVINPEVPSEVFNIFLKVDRLLYCSTIFHAHAMYKDALASIEKFEIKDFGKLEYTERNEYLRDLILIYRKTCLFRKDEIFEFFRAVGFSQSNMNWFMDMPMIIAAVQEIIDNNKIVVFPGSVLSGIFGYLIFRATSEVFMWAGEYLDNYDGIKFQNTIHRRGKNFFRHNKRLGVDFLEVDVLLEMMGFSFDNIKYKKMALAHLNGDTTKVYLQGFVSQAYAFSNIKSKNKFFAEFFNLIKLVQGEPGHYVSYRNLKSKEDFAASNPALYDLYKGKRMKEIFGAEDSLRMRTPKPE